MFHLLCMITFYYLSCLHKFNALPPPKYPPESLVERYTCNDYPILSLPKDQWVHYAINKYARYFHGAKVAVFGSMQPWAEAAALYAGAKEVVTVEYNLLTYNYSNAGNSNSTLRTVSSSGFDAFYRDEVSSFDIALSASSFDHDGLGRYGDPLNPDADLEAMAKARSILKPGGLLFLTVPVGPDVLVFNLHRRYGPARLPLLLGLDRAEHSLLSASLAQSDCMCGDRGAGDEGSCAASTDLGNEELECSSQPSVGEVLQEPPQHPGDDSDNAVTTSSSISSASSSTLSSSSSVEQSQRKEKWTLLDKIGWVEARLTQPANWRQTYEPIFVLQKQTETSLT
eukprot:gene29430-38523_t